MNPRPPTHANPNPNPNPNPNQETETMTPERASYIIANQLIGGSFRRAYRQSCDSPWTRTYPDGITPAEHAAVLELWRTMPGWTCYADAVRRIAQQATPAQP